MDRNGWIYTGAEAGAFRSTDGGRSWQAYVVNMVTRTGSTIQRVAHDYQRLVVDFAGGSVAFPSDQGLFLKPAGDSTSLINACGNMSNNIALVLAVSEGAGGANYLVTTVWDWSPIASWNSGSNWPAAGGAEWPNAPHAIGEGGTAYGMGRSNHVVMLHYHNIYYSSDGGQNFTYIRLPDSANAHSSTLVYTRAAGSRSEPAGPIYTVMSMSPTMLTTAHWERGGQMNRMETMGRRNEEGDDDDDDKDDGDDDEGHLVYTRFGEQRDVCADCSEPGHLTAGDTFKYVLKSANFGLNWTWTKLPGFLQAAESFAVDPTDAGTLYCVAADCLSKSTDGGESWGACVTANGLEGSFSSLIVKDSTIMIMLRDDDVPVRTKDGGTSWQPLTSAAKISTSGYTRSGSYSWSAKTLVLHGRDVSAPARGIYAGYVLKSRDDGDTWADETDDLVTMAVNAGAWFKKDFYLTTSGEGILLKRNFDA